MRFLFRCSLVALCLLAASRAHAWSVEVSGGPVRLEETEGDKRGAEHEGKGLNAMVGTTVRPWLTLRAEGSWYRVEGPRNLMYIDIAPYYDPSDILTLTYGVRLQTPPPKSGGLQLFVDSGVGAGWARWGDVFYRTFNGPAYTEPAREGYLWTSSIAGGAHTVFPRPWPNIGVSLRGSFVKEHANASTLVQPTLNVSW